MCSDSPDMGGMNRAAEANAAIAKEALDFYKQEYEATRPQREATQARANEVSDAQLLAQQQQNEITKDYADYQKNTFRPLEQKMVDSAQEFDTAQRRDQAAAEAVADVELAQGSNMAALNRNVARSGGTMSGNQAMALAGDAALAGTKMRAGAANTARRNVETLGYARMADAANLGRNLASNQATSAGVALQQGNSSVGNSNAANATGMSGAGLMGQGFGTAIQGNASAGNIYGQVASMQQKAGETDLGGLASLGMAGAKLWAASDEDIKSGTGKPAKTASMLEAVVKTPVDEDWRYDQAKGGPDDGGQKHTGPMAQDVQKNMGDMVAPGGKVIDMVSMNGITMGAVQELAKRLKKIESKVSA